MSTMSCVDWSAYTHDCKDGRMEAKFFVSCRCEHEAEDAQNGVDEEKIVAFSMPRLWSGGVTGVISQAVPWACTKMLLRSKVKCCVCIFVHSRFSLLFHCSVPFI